MPLRVTNIIGFGVGAGTSGGGVTSLSISGTPVLTATEGVAYAGFTAVGDGGDPPYTFSLVGTWPSGISVNSSTGEVSGTPTESGTFASLSVRLTDQSAGTRDLPTFTLEVEAGGVAAGWYLSALQSDATGNPRQFSGYDIGVADASRVVVAAIGHGHVGGNTITGVTIGGVTASLATSGGSVGNFARVEIWYAVVPSGTTCDVEVTCSASPTGTQRCAVYYGYPATSTPLDTGGQNTVASGAICTASDIQIGVGGILIAARAGDGGVPSTFAWTGSDAFSKDAEVSDTSVNFSVGHIQTTEATTTDDLTCDPSGSSANTLRVASWL